MNYLIVVPRIVSKIGDFYMFPTGIAYISAALIEAGFNVYKLNLNNIDLPVDVAMKNDILKNNIDVVLTGGLTGQYGTIRATLEGGKKVKNDLINIVGGGIITSLPIEAMKALEVADFGVIGEGEYIVCELLNFLEKEKGSIEDIPGIVYKKRGKYFISDGKPETVDINNIPFPDYRDFGLEEVLGTAPNIIGMSDENTFPVITSRGCPFNCSFCFHSTGNKYRQRSLDDVFDEIDFLIDEYDIKYFSIQDELFGYNIDRVKEFCSRIKPYNVKWFAQFRVTDISEKLVAILKDANCAAIGFGIESADNRVLESMNKKITIEDTNKALEIVHSSGIAIQGNLIFGDIAETVETAENTIKWWKKNIRYGLQLSLVVTYPGTAIFNYASSKGLIKDPVQFIKDSCPTVRLSSMNRDEYVWMIEQILSVQRIQQCLPQESEEIFIDYEKSSMNLSGKCRSCGAFNTWEKIKFFIAESIVCNNCGRRHYSPIPEPVVERLGQSIEKLTLKYGKICFWGINSYFYALFKRLKVHKSVKQNIRCVDKSEIRHGIKLSGVTVEPNDVIEKEKIGCVIVTVPQYYTSIAPSIEAEFSHVNTILNISDLITDNFFEYLN